MFIVFAEPKYFNNFCCSLVDSIDNPKQVYNSLGVIILVN